MQDGYIEIIGARVNNLKNISLKIPKKKLTIFTGVSGSGKSSIGLLTVLLTRATQLLSSNITSMSFAMPTGLLT